MSPDNILFNTSNIEHLMVLDISGTNGGEGAKVKDGQFRN